MHISARGGSGTDGSNSGIETIFLLRRPGGFQVAPSPRSAQGMLIGPLPVPVGMPAGPGGFGGTDARLCTPAGLSSGARTVLFSIRVWASKWTAPRVPRRKCAGRFLDAGVSGLCCRSGGRRPRSLTVGPRRPAPRARPREPALNMLEIFAQQLGTTTDGRSRGSILDHPGERRSPRSMAAARSQKKEKEAGRQQ
jgi:hypothetical protein